MYLSGTWGGGGGYGAECFEHSPESLHTALTASGYCGHPAPTHIYMLPSVCVLKHCSYFFLGSPSTFITCLAFSFLRTPEECLHYFEGSPKWPPSSVPTWRSWESRRMNPGLKSGFEVRHAWLQVPALKPTTCVTSGKSLNLSELHYLI